MSAEIPPPRPKLSQAPSWIMVGFVVGVLAVWGFKPDGRAPAADTAAPAVPAPARVEPVIESSNASSLDGRPSLVVVEALFEQYRDYAFWENEMTEIAVWNITTNAFSDHFEIVRTNTGTYYRPIDGFTRLPLEDYGPEHCPVRFSETPRMRAARYRQHFGAPPRPPTERLEFPTVPREPGRN